MAEKMIGYCGIICTDCPAYIATQNDDMEELQRIAARWRELFDPTVTAEGIICDGCLSDTRLSDHCGICPVRACAVDRAVITCAHCDDYACKTLTDFLPTAPAEAKDTLEEIRRGLQR